MTKPKKPAARPPGTNTGTDDDDDDDDTGDTTLGREEITRLVNATVSAQLARKLPAAIEAGTTPILAKLDELGTAVAGGAKGKGKAKAKRRRDDDDEDDQLDDDSEVAQLRRELADMQGKLKAQADERAKEAKEARETRIQADLKDALTKAKIDPLRLKGAAAVVRDLLVVDEKTGKATYRAKRDGYDEDLELEAGVAEWAATDEGKSYIAATGAAGGSGARPPGTPQGGGRKPAANTPEAKVQARREATEQLLGAVKGLVAGGSIAIE